MNESERKRLRDERKRLRDSYAELFAELTEILARHDLMGHVEIGAPADEYEPEVGTILPRLRSAADADDVQRIVQEEFVRWFAADIPMAPQAESLRPQPRFGRRGVASDAPAPSKAQRSFRNTGPGEGAVLDCAQMVAVPLAAFVLHLGQTRTFRSARAGDTVVCVGRGTSIRLRVPRQSPGGNDYRTAFNKKLSLTLGPRDPRSPHHPPGVVARCTSR